MSCSTYITSIDKMTVLRHKPIPITFVSDGDHAPNIVQPCF